MYELIIGEINPNRKVRWDNGNTDPYSVIDRTLFSGNCTIGTLQEAAKCFYDEIQVDWGCFAWKTRKDELLRFFKRKGYHLEQIEKLDEFKEYAVVYIDR